MKKTVFASIITLASFVLPAAAQNVTWDGDTSATWSTGGNWDTGTAPVAANTAVFSAASPLNQPTVTGSTSVTGFTFTVNPQITINSGFTLTATGASGTTGSAGVTLKGAGNLSFTATGSNLNFGSGTITLDGGGFGLTGSEIAINTTTGLPTGGGGTDRNLLNNIAVTSNGGRLIMNGSSGTTGLAIAFNTLTLGGALTTTSAGGGNDDGYTIAGTVTLQQDTTRTLRITNNTSHNGADWIAGQITDGAGSAGNALRIAIANRTLRIGNSGNNYAGGTIIEASGSNNYSYLDVLSAATLGTGNLTVESGGRIRLNNATATGVAGNLASSATISAAAGSVVGVNSSVNVSDRFTASSAGVYGIEGTRSYNLDMSTLGNGRMFLGTITGGSYSGALTAGADNTYRIGGGSSASTLTGTANTNVITLTGTNMLTGANKLLVASGLNTNASAGRVVVAADQDFVGTVTVNSDGLLATSQNGGTPFGNTSNQIEVFGSLAATGVNGAFNSTILPNITFRPGSSLVFNNNNFNNTTGGNNTNRWSDAQGVTLNGSSINLQGARSADSSETVGAVSYNGNSRLILTRNSTSAQDVHLTAASLTRASNSTMAISVGGTSGMTFLGGDTADSTYRVVLSGGAPTLLNSSTMVAPYMVGYETDSNGNAVAGAFLTYNSASGTNVAGTRGFTAATFGSTNLNTATSTDIVNAAATALSSDRSVYALKVTGAITLSGANDTVTIGSGSDPAGLIDQANNVTHTAFFDFGSREAVLWKLSGVTSVYNGILTSGGLTKSGAGAITLGSTGHNISGGITINQGQVNIGSSSAATDVSDNLLTLNNEGTFNLNDFNTTVAGLSGVGRGGNVTNSSANVRTLTIDLASGSKTYEGKLQATGTAANLALVKSGNGTQIFSSTSVGSYTGTTQVNSGTLIINGDFSGATGTVNVGSTATLGGSGTIGGTTTISGVHSPGNSPGLQTFVSGLNYDTGSSFVWELNANTIAGRGTSFDGVNVGGNLDFNPTTTFNLAFNIAGSAVDWSDSLWNSNQQWLVWDVAGTTTDFSALSLSTTNWADGQGDLFNTVRGGSSFYLSQSGSDVYLNYASAIPEPGTYAMLIGGLSVLFFLRRKVREKA